MSPPWSCLILGAAGRDFHDFLTFFRKRPEFVVRAFTAAQIPFIAERSFPRELAGPGCDADIPIYPEERLPELVRELGIDFVFLAYSDLPHERVMHLASEVQSLGASFAMLGPAHTELASKRPVIAVVATRTGAGKSPLSHHLTELLLAAGKRPGVLRHPMPYGDLSSQSVQRFASEADLDRHACSIEEREEYVPYLELGVPVFAGVDYARILELAEAESDVVLWDGGNNDRPFVRAGLAFVVADALRAGHELTHHPGETNFRRADVVVVNKVSEARAEDVALIRRHAAELAPRAQIVEADLVLELDGAERITGRRVLVVEDGPTLTHGGMSFGAGAVAARRHGAAELVDPRPFAVGSIAALYREFAHLGPVLPAMGYSAEQRAELAETIARSGAELVVDASPARIDRALRLSLPVIPVRYRFAQRSGTPVGEIVNRFLAKS